MIVGSIARRYAKAMIQIGRDNKSSDAINKELERLAALLSGSPELVTTLESPVFKQSERRAVLEELSRRLALSPVVRSFMLLLLERGRIGALPAIAREHRALVDEMAGRVRVLVTSARPLDPQLEARLKGALEKRTGKIVFFDKREDPLLVGGLIAQVGDIVYDGSVRTQLANLRQQLLAD